MLEFYKFSKIVLEKTHVLIRRRDQHWEDLPN